MSAGAPTPPALLALDVDGTLLRSDGTLPAERAAALTDVATRVRTILATGKTWPSIADLVGRFDLPGPHVICNGAALVTSDGAIEVLAALPDDVVDEVSAELARRDVAVAAYLADGAIVAAAADRRFAAITDLGEPEPEIRGADGVPVLKLLAVVRAEDEGDLRGLRSDAARIQRTGEGFLEWNAPSASKGAALTHLATELGAALGDVVAVGDSENDVTMLQVAGLGVAVAGSSAAAVAAADEHLDVDVAGWLRTLAGGAG